MRKELLVYGRVYIPFSTLTRWSTTCTISNAIEATYPLFAHPASLLPCLSSLTIYTLGCPGAQMSGATRSDHSKRIIEQRRSIRPVRVNLLLDCRLELFLREPQVAPILKWGREDASSTEPLGHARCFQSRTDHSTP